MYVNVNFESLLIFFTDDKKIDTCCRPAHLEPGNEGRENYGHPAAIDMQDAVGPLGPL